MSTGLALAIAVPLLFILGCMIPTNPRTTEDRMTWDPQPETNDATRVFLTQGDFARGQRLVPVRVTWIGSFATGQSNATRKLVS